ncbi:MAG: FAD-dependent oxidoreductase, partial [Bryobacterales bacterium]|nr:FAD-dependent oxidoreductase [Bryobacterales bacterium]
DAPAETVPFSLPPNTGKGTKVAVLGAGIAGLVAAYELRNAGFDCTVLEARDRPGGRNWTIRRGNTVEFIDGTIQRCAFDEGLYFNAGPGRIPSIHRTMLRYCRELGVAMEVEVNTSRSALLQCDGVFGSAPLEQREAINDARGHVAELLSKAIRRGALDEEITAGDRERMLAFLRSFGDLQSDYVYAGSSRAGVKRFGGAGDLEEEAREPLPMGALLDASFWRALTFEEGLDMQATMLQPVGGMDRIPYAFAKHLGNAVKYRCPVKEIRKTSRGVRVVYAEHASGSIRTLEADYCICTLPVSVLKNTGHDFSPGVAAAIRQVDYASGYKIAWEARRFWEQDDNIYGGISWLAHGPVSLESGSVLANVWYPSGGLLSEKGVLVAGYGTEMGEFGSLPTIEAKLAASRAAVEKLHPGRGKELTKPLYVAWAKIPFSLGSWLRGGPGYYDGPYRDFIGSDDRIYFAGDHCSHVNTWQEGAALSAQRAVGLIASRTRERV